MNRQLLPLDTASIADLIQTLATQQRSIPEKSIHVPRWKRLLDIGCIVFSVPVVFPLVFLLVVFIKSVSRGPAFIRQERIGFRCRPFMCWKLRTMHVGADTRVHQQHFQRLMSSHAPMTKMDIKGDIRLIRCGAFIRALGLDELPQLINIACGDMSLVGPRPCLRYEYEKYLPWHRARFDTLPGLTGLWQVSGKNKTTFTEMMHLDISYVQRKSLRMDVKILFRTVAALVSQLKELRG